MPYKDIEAGRAAARRRYIEHPEHWKNPDGSWKRRPYSEVAERRRKHYAENKERIRAYYRARAKRLEKIAVCVICGRGPVKLVHDHDHKTNEWRDWICSQCNVMLGMAQDRPEVLDAGIKYLKRFSENRS